MELNLSPDALKLIAKQALEKKTGARGLRAILVCSSSSSYSYSPHMNFSWMQLHNHAQTEVDNLSNGFGKYLVLIRDAFTPSH